MKDEFKQCYLLVLSRPFHGCLPERRDQAARMETVDCHRPVTPVLSRGGLIKRSTISTNQDMASSRLVGNRWPFVEWMSKLKVKVRKLVFIIIMIRIVNKEKPARKTIVIVRIVKDKIYSQLGSNKKLDWPKPGYTLWETRIWGLSHCIADFKSLKVQLRRVSKLILVRWRS